MKVITRTIWLLSLVSLFTDVASEMLYPVIPIYLESIGYSVLLIGVLEGVAEATAGLSKGYFGKLSDTTGKRLPFVQTGYLLSALSKPMMAIFTWPAWIFTARSMDRLGKGIRTGARDAMLSDESMPQTKGKVFGFHRGMDTLGAVIGPAAALLYLYFHPAAYKTLFFIAFIPGVVSVTFTLMLKDRQHEPRNKTNGNRFFDFIRYWKTSPAAYRRLAGGLLLFTLFNSSDMFLLLKVKSSGLSDTAAIGVYIFYNLVYAVFSYPVGGLADRLGFKKVLVAGLIVFAGVYMGMAYANNLYLYLGLFLLYGVYAAATDGVSKAWISNIANKKDTATAIGTFTAGQSICTLAASSIAGLIWYGYGAAALFVFTALATLAVTGYIIVATGHDSGIYSTQKSATES